VGKQILDYRFFLYDYMKLSYQHKLACIIVNQDLNIAWSLLDFGRSIFRGNERVMSVKINHGLLDGK